jgi:tetratricopeptide (TPR) repeat protein
MDALLDDLGREPTQRTLWAAGGAMAVAGALALTLGGSAAAPCAEAGAGLDETWNASTKQAIHAALAATNRPFAEDAYRSVERTLDDLASRWSDARVEACEATHVRHVQSDTGLDLRMACLDRGRKAFEAATSVLAGADATVAERATDIARAVPDPSECADIESLVRGIEPPPAETAADVDVIRQHLAELDVLEAAGRYKDALDHAHALVDIARPLDYPPVLAEALHGLGRAQADLEHGQAARDTLFDALDLAEANRHDELALDVWLELVELVGKQQVDSKRGEQWVRRARAALIRIGEPPKRHFRWLTARGILLYRLGRYEDAEAVLNDALSLGADVHGPDDVRLNVPATTLAGVFVDTDRLDEGRTLTRQALARARHSLGNRHPQVAYLLMNLGNLHWKTGRRDEAGRALDEALGILAASHGEASVPVAQARLSIAELHRMNGDLDRALAHAQAARDTLEALLGDHPHYAIAVGNVGNALFEAGRYEQAAAAYREALEIERSVYPPAHPWMAARFASLGDALLGLRRHDEALAHYERSLALLEANRDVPPDAEYFTYPLKGKAKVSLARGRPADAARLLERALSIWNKNPEGNPFETADTKWTLARALWDRDRATAETLAREAHEIFVRLGKTREAEIVTSVIERQARED